MAIKVHVSAQAIRDMDQVLRWTLENFGERKYVEYRELLRLALDELSRDRKRARPRPEIHAEAWTLHIGRRGKKARHLLLIRIREDGEVEVARVLYDGMDLERWWEEGEA